MTAVARPRGRPKFTREEVLALVERRHPGERLPGVIVVAVRGYYRDTLGMIGVNDRGIYDDAIFLLTPTRFLAFNANADPSRGRKGQGTGAGKGMARLKPGLWRSHRLGKHKGQYLALIQTGGKVTVIRDGVDGDYEDTGYFGINVHKGGISTTSSEGCLTIPPDQWPEFINAVDNPGKAQGVVPVILIEGVE